MNPHGGNVKMWEEMHLRVKEKGHLENNLFTPNIGFLLFKKFLGFCIDKLEKGFRQRSLYSPDTQSETIRNQQITHFKNVVKCMKSSLRRVIPTQVLLGTNRTEWAVHTR